MKKNYLLESIFIALQKDKKTGDDGKITDGHISVKDYVTCKKMQDKFNMKNMGDYHDHYFFKNVLFMADVFEQFIDTYLK